MRKLLSCDEEERVKEVDELGEEVPGHCDWDHHGNDEELGFGCPCVVVNVGDIVTVALVTFHNI